jgi:hypothetical protein
MAAPRAEAAKGKRCSGSEKRKRQQKLGKTAGEIRLAYTLSQSGQEFIDGLDERGLRIARVTHSVCAASSSTPASAA